MKTSQEEFIKNRHIAIRIEDVSLLEPILKWCDINNIKYSENDIRRFKRCLKEENMVLFSLYNKNEVDFYTVIINQIVYNIDDIDFLIPNTIWIGINQPMMWII